MERKDLENLSIKSEAAQKWLIDYAAKFGYKAEKFAFDAIKIGDTICSRPIDVSTYHFELTGKRKLIARNRISNRTWKPQAFLRFLEA